MRDRLIVLVHQRDAGHQVRHHYRGPRQMPAYREKVMSDAELADVWAYLKTIPESPPAKSIALLQELP